MSALRRLVDTSSDAAELARQAGDEYLMIAVRLLLAIPPLDELVDRLLQELIGE